MSQPVYIIGTGLSHNGSAVLLKDGRICVAIEKERITRRKHDGGNDSAAIQYCLDAAGITLADVSLVVQCANFEVPDRDRFQGERLLAGTSHPPLISISHHLAHAYSAAGTCPFDSCAIMVIDGCGSPFEQCTDLDAGQIMLPEDASEGAAQGMWCEKDSFYHFDGQRISTLYKDFSPMAATSGGSLRMQTTKHSIGGFYAAVSHYVFGNLDDVGKLMGLAPYGNPGRITEAAFAFEDGRLFVREAWKEQLNRPSDGYAAFRVDFQYYADVAYWAQQQVELAVKQCFQSRLSAFPHDAVAYSGGVALNAVANARLLTEEIVKELYMEPAAGDNGLALGCAFYGWLQVLGKPKVPHDGNTCFGKTYPLPEIEAAIREVPDASAVQLEETALDERVAELLATGKIVGWFRSGAEFGPRALGHRSILAHPSVPGLGDKINAQVKFREDFRPFAPAVLPEYAPTCFVSGRKSPYMILVDQTKPDFSEILRNVTHVNGSARVQTVDKNWNPGFHALLEAFHRRTGIPVLLNTSLNKKGMPIVETPAEALALFSESALDAVVLENFLVERKERSVSAAETVAHAGAKAADRSDPYTLIRTFLISIGIAVEERALSSGTFLPGLELGPNCVYVDPEQLAYPGDLLHEAGHLAVTTAAQRQAIGTPDLEEPFPTDGEELGAVLWSYAAAVHIGLPLEVLFHPNGYKDQSAWLIDSFRSGNYIGLPFLEWAGLTLGRERAATAGKEAFPAMVKWIRD